MNENEKEAIVLTEAQYLAATNLARLEAISDILAQVVPEHSGISEDDFVAVKKLINHMSFLSRRRLSIDGE